MPFKSEKIKIQGTMFDRRRKLDEETKEIAKTRRYKHELFLSGKVKG